jgi:hypothetical protein
VTGKEELIAHALEAMVYGQVITENPSLARSGTELARRNNTLFMARLNSGDAAGELCLLTSQGNVHPGGTPLGAELQLPDMLESVGTDPDSSSHRTR